jgi:hypothetical protein
VRFGRFQVLTAMIVKMAIFFNVAPCSLQDIDRRFKRTYCLHQSDDYAVKQHRRIQPSSEKLIQRRTVVEKPIVAQLVGKFPASYGTSLFIAMFTRAQNRLEHTLKLRRTVITTYSSQVTPIHTPEPHFLNIHINIILLSPRISSQWSLHFSFSN